ncbi:conserved hypothetical protein [Mucispirillum schaedleri ASF457]|jgi:hypothetical protein|uniref:Uncharacterized protein n=4 Tax=Bacteria TaxID=2 RepID=V2RN50_9BACT|nr:PD-(D/E)XK nuclease family protein [Mucispirillum schaedleri]MCX4360461.1 PD-(D/E)XK nuclease family protein [Mucispirillum schaedleri]USF23895.1 hypothetical protein N508_000968 [Mucispirillum schaedleri ASF457]SIW06875.1 conserved hypothetical protein [Mucispirillum schaedleri ASF457]
MSEDSIKEKIRDLLLSNDFKRLTYKKDEANIFKIINMADKEIVHSDMLAWLFNPYENHNLNDKVLKEILMQLSKKDAEYINLLLLDYSDLEVYREYTVDNGRRIDIVMESKNNKVIFIIENKIWSGEGDNQLEDYKNYIDEKYSDYNRIFLFLTPEKERKEKYKGYIHITYSMIYSVLNCVLQENQIKFEISVIIRQYKEIIGRYIMGSIDKEMVDLCRKLYVEHKEALDKIMQYGNTTYYLTEVINEILDNEQIYNGKVILKNYGHIVYLPHCKSETREKLQCGFQKDREYLALTISIEIKDENVTIYLQGSGRNENNTAEQNNNYDKLKNIFEKDLNKKINKWGWYILTDTNFKSEVYTNNEEYIKKVKDSLYDKLAEPIAEFNKIISLFENMK